MDYVTNLQVEAKLAQVLSDINEVLAHRAQWEKAHPDAKPFNNNELLPNQQDCRKALKHFWEHGTLKVEHLHAVFDQNGILPVDPDTGWLVKKLPE